MRQAAINDVTLQKKFDALFNAKGWVKNYRTAFPLLLVAAKNGHPHAQNLVGYCYNLGFSPHRSSSAAVAWYKKAARKGYSEAMYNLAVCYAEGRGAPRNDQKAFKLNQRAAAAGHAWATCNLGTMYADGIGTKADPVLAVKCWRKVTGKRRQRCGGWQRLVCRHNKCREIAISQVTLALENRLR